MGIPCIYLPLADGLNGWWQIRVDDGTQSLYILMSHIRPQSGWFLIGLVSNRAGLILIQKCIWLRYVMLGVYGRGWISRGHTWAVFIRTKIKILIDAVGALHSTLHGSVCAVSKGSYDVSLS